MSELKQKLQEIKILLKDNENKTNIDKVFKLSNELDKLIIKCMQKIKKT